jgi:hypothetical protein
MRPAALFLLLGVLQALTCHRSLGSDYGASPMQLTLERDNTAFIEPHFRAYVTMDSNQFGFRMPIGYRLTGDPASGTLTLANRKGNGLITFTVSGSLPTGVSLDAAALGNSLSNQYPSAVFVQQFTRNNSVGGGPGFDLQWKISEQMVQCKRVLYIASPAGVLEFTATAGRADFPSLAQELDSILMSFQCTTNGTKPNVSPILDKT